MLITTWTGVNNIVWLWKRLGTTLRPLNWSDPAMAECCIQIGVQCFTEIHICWRESRNDETGEWRTWPRRKEKTCRSRFGGQSCQHNETPRHHFRLSCPQPLSFPLPVV